TYTTNKNNPLQRNFSAKGLFVVIKFIMLNKNSCRLSRIRRHKNCWRMSRLLQVLSLHRKPTGQSEYLFHLANPERHFQLDARPPPRLVNPVHAFEDEYSS